VRAFLLARLGQTLLVVFCSLTAVFFMTRLGGDPVLLFLPMDIQAKDVNEFRQRLGFNDPLATQYGRFLLGAARGDFGKNRTTGDMFFLGWGPALEAQGTIEQLFQTAPTYSSYGGNKVIEDKIARAVTIVDPKQRLEAWAELQLLVAAEAPWVFLWQQHDLYGVANWIEWTPRADEKVWMHEAKVVPR
jgi:ABC-type transport system substrate-binding protein